MYPKIDGITFEENERWLKIVMPVRKNWFLLIIYSLMVLTGVGLFVGAIIFAVQLGTTWRRFSLLFIVMIVIFLALLYYLMKYVLRQWQFNISNREILFFNEEEMIVRRPVSIFGLTTTFDRQYMHPLSYNDQYSALEFDYGSRPVLIGLNLPKSQTEPLATYINERYFPHFDDEDE